jgi:hypothetical protein
MGDPSGMRPLVSRPASAADELAITGEPEQLDHRTPAASARRWHEHGRTLTVDGFPPYPRRLSRRLNRPGADQPTANGHGHRGVGRVLPRLMTSPPHGCCTWRPPSIRVEAYLHVQRWPKSHSFDG